MRGQDADERKRNRYHIDEWREERAKPADHQDVDQDEHGGEGVPRSRNTSIVMCHSPSHLSAGAWSVKGRDCVVDLDGVARLVLLTPHPGPLPVEGRISSPPPRTCEALKRRTRLGVPFPFTGENRRFWFPPAEHHWLANAACGQCVQTFPSLPLPSMGRGPG